MVRAIWPAYVPPSMPTSVDAPAYTTPYLALMQEAIEHFSLSEARQEKKDSLFEWFRNQEVDGAPVSNNLADAMSMWDRLVYVDRRTGPVDFHEMRDRTIGPIYVLTFSGEF